jgi:cyclopropane-fatty-acyl-phospholipid synthase
MPESGASRFLEGGVSGVLLQRHFERAMDRLAKGAAIPVRLQLWNGRRFDLAEDPRVTISINKPSALRYFIAPDLNKLGEAFVEGHIGVEGPIHEVFEVAEHLASRAGGAAQGPPGRRAQHSRGADSRAVAYHYDVSNEFYSLFLDAELVYSCAYYRSAADTLDTAQLQKLDHILNKLIVRPGQRLLDIGCGWGALIRRAARKYGAIATGVTLSKNQYDYARERIRAEGLQDRCRVELCDYRDVPGAGVYDRIASVGMFEHVGLSNLAAYFAKIRSLLTGDGLVLNHGITTSDVENRWMGLGAGEFIDRYVFPSGELPHISLVLREMAAAGLEVTDAESLRRHYARTCRIWADRLEANRARAVQSAGEKRVRIWEIYLAGCAYGFANGWMNLYQVLACPASADARTLPLTRDYLYCVRSEESGVKGRG